MSFTQTLKTLNLTPDTMVTLNYSAGVDVFVHNETEIETALSETDVVEKFSELIATPGLRVFDSYGTNVLNELRDGDFLEDYGRDFTFEDFLCETISENFYEFDFIESSVEKYDHKRGFCTLSTEVQVSVEDLMNNTPFLHGWKASVQTAQGTLMFDT